jgi:hypothetical protein
MTEFVRTNGKSISPGSYTPLLNFLALFILKKFQLYHPRYRHVSQP